MSDATAEDAALKLELLKMDVLLRHKQVFWETPKGLLLAMATAAAVAGAAFGAIGYKIGQTPPNPIVIQLVQPAPHP